MSITASENSTEALKRIFIYIESNNAGNIYVVGDSHFLILLCMGCLSLTSKHCIKDNNVTLTLKFSQENKFTKFTTKLTEFYNLKPSKFTEMTKLFSGFLL